MRPRGRRVMRRKTRRALVLRRQDWIIIAILSLALIGSIIVWVLFLTAWNPRTTLTLYRDVVSGRRTFESLSPGEQQMVRAVIRASRHRLPAGTTPQCRDAIERAQTAAEDVAAQSRRLTSCVEGEDYRDDCASPFRADQRPCSAGRNS
jgi:hypothetical protein